jgi:hypothetical protein
MQKTKKFPLGRSLPVFLLLLLSQFSTTETHAIADVGIINEQVTYLNNLKKCTPNSIWYWSMPIPQSDQTYSGRNEIMGFTGDKCIVNIYLPQDAVSVCTLSKADLKEFTSKKQLKKAENNKLLGDDDPKISNLIATSCIYKASGDVRSRNDFPGSSSSNNANALPTASKGSAAAGTSKQSAASKTDNSFISGAPIESKVKQNGTGSKSGSSAPATKKNQPKPLDAVPML